MEIVKLLRIAGDLGIYGGGEFLGDKLFQYEKSIFAPALELIESQDGMVKLRRSVKSRSKLPHHSAQQSKSPWV
jgi:hypothetical protein